MSRQPGCCPRLKSYNGLNSKTAKRFYDPLYGRKPRNVPPPFIHPGAGFCFANPRGQIRETDLPSASGPGIFRAHNAVFLEFSGPFSGRWRCGSRCRRLPTVPGGGRKTAHTMLFPGKRGIAVLLCASGVFLRFLLYNGPVWRH
jgi:hypothetical protein